MTDKELKKLSRIDLLEMMIEQRKTVSRAQAKLEEEKEAHEATKKALAELTETYERLRVKLNEKDAKLNEKDKKLDALKAELAQERAAHGALKAETDSLAESIGRLERALQVLEPTKAEDKPDKKKKGLSVF